MAAGVRAAMIFAFSVRGGGVELNPNGRIAATD